MRLPYFSVSTATRISATLLAGSALLWGSADDALAYLRNSSSRQLPSIEINLKVLETLRYSPPNYQAVAPVPAPQPSPATAERRRPAGQFEQPAVASAPQTGQAPRALQAAPMASIPQTPPAEPRREAVYPESGKRMDAPKYDEQYPAPIEPSILTPLPSQATPEPVTEPAPPPVAEPLPQPTSTAPDSPTFPDLPKLPETVSDVPPPPPPPEEIEVPEPPAPLPTPTSKPKEAETAAIQAPFDETPTAEPEPLTDPMAFPELDELPGETEPLPQLEEMESIVPAEPESAEDEFKLPEASENLPSLPPAPEPEMEMEEPAPAIDAPEPDLAAIADIPGEESEIEATQPDANDEPETIDFSQFEEEQPAPEEDDSVIDKAVNRVLGLFGVEETPAPAPVPVVPSPSTELPAELPPAPTPEDEPMPEAALADPAKALEAALESETTLDELPEIPTLPEETGAVEGAVPVASVESEPVADDPITEMAEKLDNAPVLPPVESLFGEGTHNGEAEDNVTTDLAFLDEPGLDVPELPTKPDEFASLPEPSPEPVMDMDNGTADLRIPFTKAETSLPLSMESDLRAIATRAKEDTSLRLTVIAYAGGSEEQASTARRVSLSRALAVRTFLLDNGVDQMRINVRAMGIKNPGGPDDRVDVFVKNEGGAAS